MKIILNRECFNTQPPEGGWFDDDDFILSDDVVSTHSRPKAAGLRLCIRLDRIGVSTHSRPKAAGQYAIGTLTEYGVSTHSRPKAAGYAAYSDDFPLKSFNTQPPEGGWQYSVCHQASL